LKAPRGYRLDPGFAEGDISQSFQESERQVFPRPEAFREKPFEQTALADQLLDRVRNL